MYFVCLQFSAFLISRPLTIPWTHYDMYIGSARNGALARLQLHSCNLSFSARIPRHHVIDWGYYKHEQISQFIVPLTIRQ